MQCECDENLTRRFRLPTLEPIKLSPVPGERGENPHQTLSWVDIGQLDFFQAGRLAHQGVRGRPDSLVADAVQNLRLRDKITINDVVKCTFTATNPKSAIWTKCIFL